VRIETLPFDGLSTRALYEVLRLRCDVFVVEQDCPYLDPDGEDPAATHVLGWEDGRLIGYARIHHEDGQPRLGRFVTARAARGRGLGHDLVRACLDAIGDTRCFLHAQDHLRGFYAQHGFVPVGDVFDEDGIPHVRMERPGPSTGA
jgi:ElaA protein